VIEKNQGPPVLGGPWSFLQRDGLFPRRLMTALAVGLGLEGFFAIVADSAQFAGIDLFHADFHRSLLHFREHSVIVAVLALGTGLLVFFSIEFDHTHRAVLEFKGFPRGNREGNAGKDEEGDNDEGGQFLHGDVLLSPGG
jgi:hypothetical protein